MTTETDPTPTTDEQHKAAWGICSFTIMAHPSRKDHIATNLLPKLPRDTFVHFANTNLDASPVQSHLNNRRRILQRLLYVRGCSHHVIIQDDAELPLSPLAPHVTRIIRTASHTLDTLTSPDHAIFQLYFGTGAPIAAKSHQAFREAIISGSDWILDTRVRWGVALAIPHHHLPSLIDFWDKWASRFTHDDGVIGSWTHQNNIPVLSPIPSPVNHLDADSFFNRFGKKVERRAYLFDVAGTHEYNDKVIVL